MRDACRQMRDWQAAIRDSAKLSISINISSRLLRSRSSRLGRRVSSKKRTPARVVHLEITENALLQHESTTVAELTALRELGVKFHLDDFGTGYASLSYLNRFSYDTIKNRSIVHCVSDATQLGAISTR